MIIHWIVLSIIIFYVVWSYFKHYPFSTRLVSLVLLLIFSLVLALPIFHFTSITLFGLFLFEKLWILLAVVLFIEAALNRKNRIIKAVISAASLIVYLYLRTFI